MTPGLVHIVVFSVLGLVLGIGGMLLNWLVRHDKPGPDKDSTYECGVETIGIGWVQFKVSYFLYALVYLIFDVESVLLYPFALLFKTLGWQAMVIFGLFMGVLLIGLWYEWKEGALEWK